MYKLHIYVIIALAINQIYAQRAPCRYVSPQGYIYDFSHLAGKSYSVNTGGYTYDLTICGTSAITCPNDPDGVTSGMAVETKQGTVSDTCYVLGQYDNTANWALLNSGKGVGFTLGNGSPVDCPDGTPRTLQLNLECSTSETDNTFTIDNAGCEYAIHYKTCLACEKGCNPQPGCEFHSHNFTDKNISKFSFNTTIIDSNNNIATVKNDVINGNGNVKVIKSESNQTTTIMYIKPDNRTFEIFKHRDKPGLVCKSYPGNVLEERFETVATLVFGNPNVTSDSTHLSFPVREGSVDVAGKNLTRFFSSKDDKVNKGNILVDMDQCRPTIWQQDDAGMTLFYNYQVGGELPPSTWVLPGECYKFVEEKGKSNLRS
jgi:hypothetical protein